MALPILDVDLLAYERGDHRRRQAVVDGVMRSLATGFVFTSSDLPADLLDGAYELLERFFALEPAAKQEWRQPGAGGQTCYTGPLVETAAGAALADWKEMLNWGLPLAGDHPLRRRYPLLYPEQLLPEPVVPGITAVLEAFHRAIADLQRRFLRVIASGLGVAETFFDGVIADAPTLTRAMRYPPMAQAPAAGHLWAAAHADINLITALPRATAAGLQVRVEGGWLDACPPEGRVIINTGLMLERLSNGRLPAGWHRVVAPPEWPGHRLSVVQFCHARPWVSLGPLASCCGPDNPQRWPAITAAEALEDVLYAIRLLGA
ncbi:MAG: isopenicillin N synthase family dioxygenase [Prochlorococcaceae cyanobacterium]